MFVRGVLVLVALAVCASGARADGRIARARAASEGEPSRARSSDQPHRTEAAAATRGESRERVYARDANATNLYLIGVGPETLAETPSAAYAHYPYARPHVGYIQPGVAPLSELTATDAAPATEESAAPSSATQSWAGQVALAAGYFAGVAHSDLDMRLLTPTRLEVDVRGSMLYEPSARDAAVLWGASLGYRLLQWNFLMARLLGGVRYFGDGQAGEMGVDLGLGLDLFLGRPVVVSATLSGGNLGQALVADARIQVGVMLKRTELFAALEYLRIGPSNLSTPLIGARFWL
jgi:hypothetical protein